MIVMDIHPGFFLLAICFIGNAIEAARPGFRIKENGEPQDVAFDSGVTWYLQKQSFDQGGNPNNDFYNIAHIYAFEKIRNRIEYAKDFFTQNNRLTEEGKAALKKFTYWLMISDDLAVYNPAYLEDGAKRGWNPAGLDQIHRIERSQIHPSQGVEPYMNQNLKDINTRWRNDAIALIDAGEFTVEKMDDLLWYLNTGKYNKVDFLRKK